MHPMTQLKIYEANDEKVLASQIKAYLGESGDERFAVSNDVHYDTSIKPLTPLEKLKKKMGTA